MALLLYDIFYCVIFAQGVRILYTFYTGFMPFFTIHLTGNLLPDVPAPGFMWA